MRRDDAPADHRERRAQRGKLTDRDAQRITVVGHKIGQQAWLEGSESIALAQQACRIGSVKANGGCDVYSCRGDAGLAFHWLNRAYQQRDSGMRSLKIDPLLKSLRQDPRYIDLLKRMRLPT